MKCNWRPSHPDMVNRFWDSLVCTECGQEKDVPTLSKSPEILTRTCPASPKPMPDVPPIAQWGCIEGTVERGCEDRINALIICVTDLQERIKTLEAAK